MSFLSVSRYLSMNLIVVNVNASSVVANVVGGMKFVTRAMYVFIVLIGVCVVVGVRDDVFECVCVIMIV